MKELNELVELANKATPGKWWVDSHGHAMVAFTDNNDMEVVFVTKSDAMGVAKRHEDTGNLSHWRNDNDATFIAAANPDAILAIAAAFRALKQRAEAAEAKLAELEKQEPIYQLMDDDTWYDAEPHIYHEITAQGYNGRIVYRRPAPAVDLAELVPQCLVDAMSNLNLEGVSIGDKAIIAKSIEVLRKIEEAK